MNHSNDKTEPFLTATEIAKSLGISVSHCATACWPGRSRGTALMQRRAACICCPRCATACWPVAVHRTTNADALRKLLGSAPCERNATGPRSLAEATG